MVWGWQASSWKSLIYNVAETLYIWNEQVAGKKNTAAIKPKREIIKLNKNLKFSCLPVLEKKQVFVWEDEEIYENIDGEAYILKEFRSWWLLKNYGRIHLQNIFLLIHDKSHWIIRF